MRSRKLLAAVVAGTLAFVLVGLCLVDQAPLMTHVEDTETCCGVAQCSVLAVGMFALGLCMVFTALRLATAIPIRSAIQLPIVPPPELSLLASA